MKKLAIMFVMLLGSVATMQAQSFDFSCHVVNNLNNQLDFDLNQDALFLVDETVSLDVAGFSVGNANLEFGADAGDYTDINHYAVNIQIGPDSSSGFPGLRASVTLDVESDTEYIVTTFNVPNVINDEYTYTTFDAALNFMIAAHATIIPWISEFSEADEMMLEESPFELDLDPQYNFIVWSRTIFTSETYEDQAEIWVYNGKFRANVEGEGHADFATLQEAMDWISSWIYTPQGS